MNDDGATVESALEKYVGPLVARDGGSVRLVSFADDIATVALEGACLGCPARTITRDLVVTRLLTKELGRPITVELS